MSGENVEIVRRGYAAFATGGMESALPFFTEDTVVYSIPEWPDDPEYHGHDGLRKLDRQWRENFDDFGFDVRELRDADDAVVSLCELTGRMKGSGVPMNMEIGAVFSEFKDERIGARRLFPSWQSASKPPGCPLQGAAEPDRGPDQREADQGGSGEAHPARVSHANPRCASQALIPVATAAVVIATAGHCMHMPFSVKGAGTRAAGLTTPRGITSGLSGATDALVVAVNHPVRSAHGNQNRFCGGAWRQEPRDRRGGRPQRGLGRLDGLHWPAISADASTR